MKENETRKLGLLRAALRRLASEDGHVHGELDACADDLARFYETEEELFRLRAENERLRQELKRQRQRNAAKRSEAMSSKLKDALRE